jgi:hypothetical protein
VLLLPLHLTTFALSVTFVHVAPCVLSQQDQKDRHEAKRAEKAPLAVLQGWPLVPPTTVSFPRVDALASFVVVCSGCGDDW